MTSKNYNNLENDFDNLINNYHAETKQINKNNINDESLSLYGWDDEEEDEILDDVSENKEILENNYIDKSDYKNNKNKTDIKKKGSINNILSNSNKNKKDKITKHENFKENKKKFNDLTECSDTEISLKNFNDVLDTLMLHLNKCNIKTDEDDEIIKEIFFEINSKEDSKKILVKLKEILNNQIYNSSPDISFPTKDFQKKFGFILQNALGYYGQSSEESISNFDNFKNNKGFKRNIIKFKNVFLDLCHFVFLNPSFSSFNIISENNKYERNAERYYRDILLKDNLFKTLDDEINKFDLQGKNEILKAKFRKKIINKLIELIKQLEKYDVNKDFHKKIDTLAIIIKNSTDSYYIQKKLLSRLSNIKKSLSHCDRRDDLTNIIYSSIAKILSISNESKDYGLLYFFTDLNNYDFKSLSDLEFDNICKSICKAQDKTIKYFNNNTVSNKSNKIKNNNYLRDNKRLTSKEKKICEFLKENIKANKYISFKREVINFINNNEHANSYINNIDKDQMYKFKDLIEEDEYKFVKYLLVKNINHNPAEVVSSKCIENFAKIKNENSSFSEIVKQSKKYGFLLEDFIETFLCLKRCLDNKTAYIHEKNIFKNLNKIAIDAKIYNMNFYQYAFSLLLSRDINITTEEVYEFLQKKKAFNISIIEILKYLRNIKISSNKFFIDFHNEQILEEALKFVQNTATKYQASSDQKISLF